MAEEVLVAGLVQDIMFLATILHKHAGGNIGKGVLGRSDLWNHEDWRAADR
jgi:hypothetical protein